MDIVIIIGVIVLTVVNFCIYHKIFQVTYFGSAGKSIIGEFLGCFLVAMIEVAALLKVGDALMRTLFVALGFLFKIVIAIIIVIAILLIIASMLPDNDKENNSEEKKVEIEESEKDVEDVGAFKNRKILNVVKIIIICILVYLLFALFMKKENNNDMINETNNPNEQSEIEYIEESNHPQIEQDTKNFKPIGEGDYTSISDKIEFKDCYRNRNDYLIPYAWYQEILNMAYEQFGEFTKYSIIDLDDNDVDELIITYGDSSADTYNAIYSLNSGSSIFYGTFPGELVFYEASVVESSYLDGVIGVNARQGVQTIYHIFINWDDRLYVNELFTEEVGEGETYIYDQFEPIPSFYVNEFSTNRHWGY